ncbi:hypothetical protein LGK95_01340 [Clostridium algoriphilum]|uniref:hypothetical protein n=1 Tax=Clostridium algoriphilum TaxID=198347 RepID=UPI001CF21892|nr:hypothetical protein [Clostridium algoriphilum]MCB2292180.1 hypothetical protein [Clostridium algoriphilum]
MNENNLVETKKSNKQLEGNTDSSTYSNEGINSSVNDSISKSKARLINEQDNNDFYLSNGDLSAYMSSMSNMNSDSDAAALEETKQLNARSAANKGNTKK